MEITRDILYVGVDDRKTDLFEGQYKIRNGISYNSYIIIDEKIAVMDTVDVGFTEEWLEKIRMALSGRTPDYLVVQHMEPDHSASIDSFVRVYPSAVIVSSEKAFNMMKNFFGTDFAERRLVISEGSELALGRHRLSFIAAPMVHWPEVIVTYDSTDKVLFSADGFGKFGASDICEPWEDEARRYYIGIVGKYGAQVTALLKKASALDIEIICPLHGPVLKENLGHYLNLYSLWAGYKPEKDGVVIAYCSVYGNTKKAAMLLAEKLKTMSCETAVYDLARCDVTEAVADAFRYSKLVLASPTYNSEVFPFMRNFLSHLTERNFSNRTVAFIENGSWSPNAAKTMRKCLEQCRNISFAENSVTILSAMNGNNLDRIAKLAAELAEKNT